MKNIIKNKIYYLKKQSILRTSKNVGAEAIFDFIPENRNSVMYGNWVEETENPKPEIAIMKYEFFKVFSDKK